MYNIVYTFVRLTWVGLEPSDLEFDAVTLNC